MFRQSVRRFGSAATRVVNFNAGPAGLPVPVLEEAQRDLLNWKGCGMGVMEMSHRSKEYDSIHTKAIEDLTKLLNIPKNYKVLFMQAGASNQFSMVPLNLLPEGASADYLVTGAWSQASIKEAKKFGKVNAAFDGSKNKFTSIAPQSDWKLDPKATFLSYCDNETVHGVEFPSIPEVGAGVTLVADMSSNFISKPVDVSKFGLIYAGAQKNVAPSGVVVGIIREDLLGKAAKNCPVMLDYKTYSDSNSLYNTPPCWAIYMAGLVFDYNLKLGGLNAVRETNTAKADALYSTIDGSNFYHAPVEKPFRSNMNVPFRVGKDAPDENMEKKFLAEAAKEGMQGLPGHRSVGGCRASIYNSVSLNDVQKLVAFMKKFELANKK
jgi:phosphoserine aminotransferase